MKMQFNETAIPKNFERGLLEEKCMKLPAAHADKVATIVFTGASECLKALKSTEKPTVFKFVDLKGDIIALAIVRFIASEDSKTPGHWNYVWSFDKEDIPEGAYEVDITNTLTHPYFVAVAGNKFNIAFESDSSMIEVLNYILKSIKKFLIDNASVEEVTEVELDGVFLAASGVENDEVQCSLEVVGDTKAIIKSDKDDEIK